MTIAQVKAQINSQIVTNGNKEITAAILNPILIAMVDAINDKIGNLASLSTTDQSNLVAAINSIVNGTGQGSELVIFSGEADPNVTPPTGYAITNYYWQTEEGATVALWQYNGLEWVKIAGQSVKVETQFIPISDWTINLESQITDWINTNGLSVGEGNMYLYGLKPIESETDGVQFQKYTWAWKAGKGEFTGGVVPGDLFFIANSNVSGNNNIIDLGEIQDNPIEDIVNVSGPFSLSPLNANAFRVTREGDVVYYLYYGQTGSVGSGAYQTDAGDYVEITTIYPNTTGGGVTQAYVDGKIQNQIVQGVTDKAPAQDVVFDAIATLEQADNDLALQIDDLEEDLIVLNGEAVKEIEDNDGNILFKDVDGKVVLPPSGIPHTAINDYENIPLPDIEQLLIEYYQRVLDDGGTIENYLGAGDFVSGDGNYGNIIRNIEIVDGKVVHIELDFLKVGEIPPIPASKIIGLEQNLNLPLPSYSFDGYKHYMNEDAWQGEPNLVRMDDGNILMVYRKSTYYVHVGNTGEIAGRISTDEGETFGDEFIIFSDQYDDRNQITGVMPNGDIIILFRRFDEEGGSGAIDTGFVRSTDNGATWSGFTPIIDTASTVPTGQFMIRGTDVFFVTTYMASPYQVRLWKSTDNFATTPTYEIIIADGTKVYSEPILVDIGEGKSMIIMRNNSSSMGQLSYYQYNSEDGENFTYKGETNIFDDLPHSARSICSVQYNAESNELIVITNSRALSYTQPENLQNELRIYIQDADAVFADEKAYELKNKIPRPVRNDYWFYGYSGIVESENGYLVAISDFKAFDRQDTLNSKNEHSSIHTFRLNRIETDDEFLAYELKEPRLVIQNGYTGGKDYIDYDTVSNLFLLDDYLKIDFSIPDQLINISSRPLTAADRLRWITITENRTITLPLTLQPNYQFQGNVEKDVTLTIVPGEGLSVNGEPDDTEFIISGPSVFRIKYLYSNKAVLEYEAGGDPSNPIVATGGEVSTLVEGDKQYKIHIFTGADNFEVLSNIDVEYLIVGGGGGGGSYGGGGAGGVLTNFEGQKLSLTPNIYPVVIGSGGTNTTSNDNGGQGGNSSFNSLVAIGGGAGAGGSSNVNPTVGGSGGGGGAGTTNQTGAAGTSGQGSKGGNGAFSGSNFAGGGGGGASTAGTNASLSPNTSGNGGAGIDTNITGETLEIAGGGGGGNSGTKIGGAATHGGGSGLGTASAKAGTANTGGGGGASRPDAASGFGGSGIVIIRYEIGAENTPITNLNQIATRNYSDLQGKPNIYGRDLLEVNMNEHIVSNDDVGKYIQLKTTNSIITIPENLDLVGKILKFVHTGGDTVTGGVLIRSVGGVFITAKYNAAFNMDGVSPYRVKQYLGVNNATLELYFISNNSVRLSGDLVNEYEVLENEAGVLKKLSIVGNTVTVSDL